MHELIRHNAALIRELHARVHRTCASRNLDAAHRQAWEAACAEFHARYDMLCFPGSYERALVELPRGDRRCIEAALAFLEVRPYFFRSQYMRTKLKRLLKRLPLTPPQRARFDAVAKI